MDVLVKPVYGTRPLGKMATILPRGNTPFYWQQKNVWNKTGTAALMNLPDSWAVLSALNGNTISMP